MNGADEQRLKAYTTPEIREDPQPRGRPFRHTDAIEEVICESIKHGNTREAAARAAGIGERTLYEWMGEFPHFSQSIKKADAEAEGYAVECIQKKMRTSWYTAAWWLERRRPGKWGKNPVPDCQDKGEDEDWIFRTRLPSGGVLVVSGDADFDKASDAALRDKE